jgi:hypothetical protein
LHDPWLKATLTQLISEPQSPPPSLRQNHGSTGQAPTEVVNESVVEHQGRAQLLPHPPDVFVRLGAHFLHCHHKLSIVSSTVTPLVFAGIFYASNGRYHISYIDALFNCVSAMCVCGLTTVNFSSLTGWQQTIMVILMWIGHPVS